MSISTPRDRQPIIRPLSGYEEYEACAKLQDEIWGPQYVGFCSPVLQWIAHSVGGVSAGAFDDQGELLGFVIGLTGLNNGRTIHWSHMLGVRAEFRGRGIGWQLKRYQGAYLLPLGVEAILNSFDPLNSVQANLSLSKLGAVVRQYKRDFYPTSRSPLHRSIGTDRLISQWDPRSPEVLEKRGEPSTDDRRLSGGPVWATAPLVNSTFMARRPEQEFESLGSTYAGVEVPCCAEPDLSIDSPLLRFAIPHNIRVVQELAPEVAADWRLKTRRAFEWYLGRGYRAVALWAHPPFSSYLLSKEASESGSDIEATF